MYVWWSECGLGFGSDADNFEFKNINVHVCGHIGGFVGPRWVCTLGLVWAQLDRFLVGYPSIFVI